MPDGNTRSVKERFDHGKAGEVSELSARRNMTACASTSTANAAACQQPHAAKRSQTRPIVHRKHCPALCPAQPSGNDNHTCAVHLIPRFGTVGAHGSRCPARYSDSHRNADSQQPQDHHQCAGYPILRFWITPANAERVCRKSRSQHSRSQPIGADMNRRTSSQTMQPRSFAAAERAVQNDLRTRVGNGLARRGIAWADE